MPLVPVLCTPHLHVENQEVVPSHHLQRKDVLRNLKIRYFWLPLQRGSTNFRCWWKFKEKKKTKTKKEARQPSKTPGCQHKDKNTNWRSGGRSIMSWGKWKFKQDVTTSPYIRMAKIQNTDTTKCWQGCQQERSFIFGGNAKWYSHLGRQFGGFS